MSLSKRQQARNERTLQDLIKSVPGNNVCADCSARNPGWASWSLGIFLCMRCAALHRKMGTHISKVKSLSMDSWSNDQVENMKRVGNIASNRIYNPQNAKPPIPFDVDEADSAMERFIRQKYMERTAKAPVRNNTGSTNSDDQPPPLPPKTGSRFGFRSASSIFPLSSKHRREAARPDLEDFGQRMPSPPRNKQSRVFGTSVGAGDTDDLDLKMGKLRDMGFKDEKTNMAILKGLGGNLEKTIETLVRFGDSSKAGLKPAEVAPVSRSRSPMSATAGLTINRTREAPSPQSNNPFDMLDAPPPIAQPQSSQSTGSMAHSQGQMMGSNPYQPANSNPFGLMPSQSQYNLNQAFQNMSVSNSQPLFPNHTGGFPGPQPPQNHLYQQSMTPPVPSLPQQYYPSVIYENPAQQPVQNNYNPFTQQQIPQVQQPPLLNTTFENNPYNQPVSTQQNLYQSPLEQTPSQQYSSTYYGNNAQHIQQMNPFLNQNGPQQQMNPFFNQENNRQQTYPPLMAQQTGRADKRSILDLYNYPQLAPAPMQQAQPQQDQGQAQSQGTNPGFADFQLQQRSVSSPLQLQAGNKNPFALGGGGVPQNPTGDLVGNMPQFAPSQNGPRHASQESVNVDGGWHNGDGRHSPDAWGSISARALR
ncbi:ArfGap-domain-containing protein [Stipitochalara longipes BDJ]|nr:ArfGap-domain-containing protein [Stipitochalara longipes BDJ]